MQENDVTLDSEEHKRVLVLNRVLIGDWSAHEAALALGVSDRQLRRLKAAYQEEGAAGLVHGNRGRLPAHTLPDELRARVVALAQEKYAGFNHQHLTEKLADEEGLLLSRSTVRRIVAAAGIQPPRPRRAPKHRSRRERMAQEGMLLQADGSRHQWLGPNGPYLTLIAGIDDATGTVPCAVFRENEDAQGYMEWLQAVVLCQGIPLALYVDRHGIFTQNPGRRRSVGEQLAGTQLPTQFGRLLQELRIMLIHARSPQAKGLIERVWGTFQDRLTSEMRLAGATTLAEAQDVVTHFLPGFNQRFAVPAAQPGSAYRPVPEGFVPEEVFCFKYRRTVAADNTISFAPHRLQIQPSAERLSYARTHVDVHERLDGSLAVYYQGRQLAHQPAPAEAQLLRARSGLRSPANLRAAEPTEETSSSEQNLSVSDVAPTATRTPRHDHPWRRQPLRQRQPEPSLPVEVSQEIAALSEVLHEPRASRKASLTRAATLLARSTLAPGAFVAALRLAKEKTLRAHAAGRIVTKQVDGRPKLMAYLFAVLEHDLEQPIAPAPLLQARPTAPPPPLTPTLPAASAPPTEIPAWVARYVHREAP